MAKHSHPRPTRWAHALVSSFLRWASHLFSTPTVRGIEHIPPKGQAAVLICNHLSYFDAIALGAALDSSKRDVMVLAKAELFRSRVFARVLRTVGVIPVFRGTAQASESLKSAHAALSHGEVVALFPEGTIPLDGKLLPFKTGAARLAMEAGVPVIPIAMTGTDKIVAANLKKVKRTLWRNAVAKPKVQVVIGKPLELVGSPDDKDAVKAATEELRNAVVALLPPEKPKHQAPLFLRRRDVAYSLVTLIPVVGVILRKIVKR